VESFRDSTEEQRRNRVPGNSELEYAVDNEYPTNLNIRDGVNISAYSRQSQE
jgi:hypothetical protein